jgi:NADP-dependent 3-hydroxy acid dehydrogenase YdfG
VADGAGVGLANAGIVASLARAEISDEGWSNMTGTDLTDVFKSPRAVAPYLIAQGSGRPHHRGQLDG